MFRMLSLCSMYLATIVTSLSMVFQPIPEPIVITPEPYVKIEEVAVVEEIVPTTTPIPTPEPTVEPVVEIVEEVVEPVVIEETDEILTQEEIELIALVTMAEAEGESEEGKRLVIDTILNRVDHERFPDTVSGVIYQSNAFSSMWNGRVDRCYVKEDICELVREELESRTNYDVVFFTAGDYGKYGVPMFPVGNHYFSSYA